MIRRWSLPGWTTLRVRLTVLLSALLLVGCAAVGIASSIAIRSFLTGRLDQQLALAGSRYAISLEHNDHDDDNDPETATVGQPVGTLGARVLDGRVTAAGVISDSSKPVVLSAADLERIAGLTVSDTDRTVHFDDLGSYRVQVSQGQDGDVLVTGLPTAPVDETLRVLFVTELIVFVAVTVVIGVIGGIAVRRSLRPLERVAATARRVSELPMSSGEVVLEERVPAGDERTEAGQVAAAVNHMLDEIAASLGERERSEQRLRQFVADASHELRTPLAVVRSHAELIERESSDLSPSVRSSLASIDSGTQRMGRLVDDLLLLARLDSGVPLAHEEVDLTRLVLDSVSDASIAGRDHRWSLDLPEEPVLVAGDEQRLHQMVGNVLTNARLHTPAGTTVSVTLSIGPPTQGVVTAELVISDDGPGIPEQLLPHITERFVRGAGARDRATGSTGLGLAIVTGIVAAHGGSLAITSRPGRTQIDIHLPVR